MQSSNTIAPTGLPVRTCVEPIITVQSAKKLAMSKFWWPQRTSIRVRFVGGDDYLRAKERQYAVQWNDFSNLSFHFVGDREKAEICVAFEPNNQSWSALGLGVWLAGAATRR